MVTEMTVTARNRGDETNFEGEVTIADKTFSYTVEFQVPLSRYMQAARGRTVAEMRQLVPITLSHEGKKIELTNSEWEIFYYAVVSSAVNIYNARTLARREIRATDHAVTKEGGKITLKPEACKLLVQPKFGCQFLDNQVESQVRPN